MAAIFEEELADLVCFLWAHKVRALRFQLGDDSILVAFFADDGLLRRADRAVVKRFRCDNVCHSLFDIGGALDVRWRIPGADAERWFAGAVRSFYHARTTGGDDHLHFLAVHELIGRWHRGLGDAADGIFRRTSFDSGLRHELSSACGAFHCRWMRRKDDGVARFDGNDRFENRCRGWIGGWHDAHEQTNRICHIHGAEGWILVDHADGLHIFDGIVQQGGCHVVFIRFVGNLAESSFFDCHLCEGHSIFFRDAHHIADDAIDLIFCVGCQFFCSDLSLAGQISGFLYRP